MKIDNNIKNIIFFLTFTYGVCKNAGFFEKLFFSIFPATFFCWQKKVAGNVHFFTHFFRLRLVCVNLRFFTTETDQSGYFFLLTKKSSRIFLQNFLQIFFRCRGSWKIIFREFPTSSSDVKMQVFLRNFFFIFQILTFFFSENQKYLYSFVKKPAFLHTLTSHSFFKSYFSHIVLCW